MRAIGAWTWAVVIVACTFVWIAVIRLAVDMIAVLSEVLR